MACQVGVGDRVEVYWDGEFAMQDLSYVGGSWWQAKVLEIPDANVVYIEYIGWDGWNEHVDIRRIRWVRTSSQSDMTLPLDTNDSVEVRCSALDKPEIWLETIILNSNIEEDEYFVPINGSENIIANRSEIRPSLRNSSSVKLKRKSRTPILMVW